MGQTAQELAQDNAVAKPVDANTLASSLYQSVSNALDGPKGIDPASLVTAFGALAGYGARWIVRRDIAAGKTADDFKAPLGVNRPHVTVSETANKLVFAMTDVSFASTLVSSMMTADANWLPDVKQTIMHNFMSINSPQYPDYSVDEKYWPAIPPQALLLMLWENQARILASTPGAGDVAVQAYALASTKAATASRHKIPMDVSGQLALETAIAMSKIDYGF